MSSPERKNRLFAKRLSLAAASLLSAGLVAISACTVQPLYSDGAVANPSVTGSIGGELSAIAVKPVDQPRRPGSPQRPALPVLWRQGRAGRAALYADHFGLRLQRSVGEYPGQPSQRADRGDRDRASFLQAGGFDRQGGVQRRPPVLRFLRCAASGIRRGQGAARRREPCRARACRAASPGHRAGSFARSGQLRPLRSNRPVAQPIFWPVFAQSARKVSSPLSVSGCLTSAFSVAGGTVATCAPIKAACLTWLTVRIEAARISVGNP